MTMFFHKKILQAKTAIVGGTKYFQNSRNTEITELKEGLDSFKVDKQKEAMKQIIASMTIGKDVSTLFPQVVKCIRTKSIELKKLVYLYLINYAKAKPELTFLAVASFNTDAKEGETALIRGLAIRTMGCIRVPMIVSYLCETLTTCFKDNDAYVRKAAALCVAKLYATNPTLVKENGFVNVLLELLKDNNAMVVANALNSLAEISILSGENLIKIKSKVMKKILTLISEANEWGQVSILDGLIFHTPKKQTQAEEIIERILPRLSHVNPSVILGAIKVILKCMDYIDNIDKVRNYCKKISSSLMTVMMAYPEIQYVLLRSLQAIVQKRPMLLDKDFKFFFVQYNDPIYVKLEKIDILYKLCDNKNYESIIKEFSSYALTELDSEMIRKSIRYLGYIGNKYEKSVDLCVEVLQKILDNNNEEAVGESVIVVRDLLRKYKGRTLELLKKINIDLIYSLTDHNAKSAAFFIIGEFCTMIPNSTEILSKFIDDFSNVDVHPNVKLQFLNACVKNFVNKPNSGEESVIICLQKGAEESENQDVRDRAYFFWRLLETEPDIAKEMMISEKPPFEFNDDFNVIESETIDNLIENMTNVSCVYLKKSNELIPPEDMILEVYSEEDDKGVNDKNNSGKGKGGNKRIKKQREEQNQQHVIDADLLGLDDDDQNNMDGNAMVKKENQAQYQLQSQANTQQQQQQSYNNSLLNDIFNFGQSTNTQIQSQSQPQFESSSSMNYNSPPKSLFNNINTNAIITPIAQIFNEKQSLTLYSQFQRLNKVLQFGLYILNNTPQSLSKYQMFFEKNSFGLGIEIHHKHEPIDFNTAKTVYYTISIDKAYNDMLPPTFPFEIQGVLKYNNNAINVSIPLLVHVMYIEGWKLTNQPFVEFFLKNKDQPYNSGVVTYDKWTNEEQLKRKFEENNIFLSAKLNKQEHALTYYSASISNVISIVIECWFDTNANGKLNVRIITNHNAVTPLVKQSLDEILG